MIKLIRWQNKWFLSQKSKFVLVVAGRRTGKTKGAAICAVIDCADGKAVLWVDTIYSNIDRYYERYFLPFIEEQELEHEWNSQKKILKIGEGFIDFRSADKPENIEGFGYQKIYLNEAGIILKKDYLYTNAILPMMMDYKDSQLIAFGTPKGKRTKTGEDHRFYLMWKEVLNGNPEYSGTQKNSYCNPFLDNDTIKKLEREIGKISEQAARQEIYAEFIEDQEGAVFSFNDLNRFKLSDINDDSVEHIYCAIDVATGGKDSTCALIIKMIGRDVYITDVLMSKATDNNYTLDQCADIINRNNTREAWIETNGAGKLFMNMLQNKINCSMFGKWSKTNKETRIMNASYNIKQYFYFREDYEVGSDYDKFMKEFLSFNIDKKKNENDDAPDTVALACDMIVGNYHQHLYL